MKIISDYIGGLHIDQRNFVEVESIFNEAKENGEIHTKVKIGFVRKLKKLMN